MTNAAIYARLSQSRDGSTERVDDQLSDGRALAARRGWHVAPQHEYSDNDVSAAGQKHRAGFAAMLEAVQASEVQAVIVTELPRLQRNKRDELAFYEAAQPRRLTLAVVRGTDIDMGTASGRMMADVLGAVARNEIEQKAERQARASLSRAEKGRPPSRRAFGYAQDGTPHPTEARALAELFSLYLAGSTMVGLARKLNADGFTSTRGKAWDDTGIRAVLRNPRYMGERYYRGERIAEGTWQPLVTPEVFEAVQARIKDSGVAKRRPARRHLGGGLYRCHCGARTRVSYDGRGIRVYVCSARRHMQRNADPVDDLVQEVIAARLRRADLADLLDTSPKADVVALRAQALAKRAKLDEIAKDYADGFLTGKQLHDTTRRVNDQLGEIEAALAEAGRSSALASIAGAPDLGDAWLGLPLDRQRAVLDTLAEVVIQPGRRGLGAFDPATVQVVFR